MSWFGISRFGMSRYGIAKRSAALFVAPLAAGVIASPWAAQAAGLPQLDFANKLTTYQVLWGAAIFAILYVLASRTALPTVERVLEARARRIAGDLESAKDSKARADAGIQAARDATAQARAEVQAAVTAALDSAKQAAEQRSAALNARLEGQLREAEREIAAARREALAALPGVATDTAAALVTRLTGTAPDPVRLSAAIGAAMATRSGR
jgi:F-type H+-transporting ATPase subunit b